MNLILLRHGETVWNAAHKLQGMRDVSLSEKGMDEAWQLHDSLIKYGVTFEKVYSSPLSRAKKTAKIITGKPSSEIIIDEDIREMSFGVNEGKYYRLEADADMSKVDPNLVNFSQNPNAYVTPEGGESFEEVIARTGAFYKRLISENTQVKGNVLVVSHGAALHALIYNIEKKTDMNDYWTPHIGNCGVVEFKI